MKNFFLDSNEDCSLLELDYFKELAYAKESIVGCDLVSFDEFKSIYEFIHRTQIRNPRDISVLLFTLDDNTDNKELSDDEECAVLHMIETVQTSLRREDVATRCSIKQVCVILINTDSSKGAEVAKRIIKKYAEVEVGQKYDFKYEIFDLDVSDEVNSELGSNYGQRFRDRCCLYNNQWISYCMGNHHLDVETYEEEGKILVNRMCVKCGYRWTVRILDGIAIDWEEGKWWNH